MRRTTRQNESIHEAVSIDDPAGRALSAVRSGVDGAPEESLAAPVLDVRESALERGRAGRGAGRAHLESEYVSALRVHLVPLHGESPVPALLQRVLEPGEAQ